MKQPLRHLCCLLPDQSCHQGSGIRDYTQVPSQHRDGQSFSDCWLHKRKGCAMPRVWAWPPVQGFIHHTEFRLQVSFQKPPPPDIIAFTCFSCPSNSLDCLYICPLPSVEQRGGWNCVLMVSQAPNTRQDWYQGQDYDLGSIESSQQKLLGSIW